jgi:hypothetical protein
VERILLAVVVEDELQARFEVAANRNRGFGCAVGGGCFAVRIMLAALECCVVSGLITEY